MRISLHYHSPGSGWDSPLDLDMDGPSTLVLIFGDPNVAAVAPVLEEVNDSFQQSQVIGCSTAGEIFAAELFEGGVAVALVRFEKSRLKAASAFVSDSSGSYGAAAEIAEQLHADDLKGVFVLCDGLLVNGSELVKGFNEILSEDVVVTGGLAGDGDRFEHTWTLFNRSVKEQQVVAAGLYGEHVTIGYGSKGGWDVFGPERLVTRSEGNVLYELDGKPALELYKNYLGDRAEGLPATGLLFPLALRGDEQSTEERVVRTILAVNEEDQSITFAGDLPEGSMTALMRANFDRLITGAAEAGEEAGLKTDAVGDVLSIAISCVGRRLVLGERTEEEIEATRDVLPAETKQIGFYSYGELSPLVNGVCDLHNQTMTLTVIHET